MAISVLPEQVVNQIAAGEVIERPASVVKELVENALDAGARRVHIAIEEGGVRLVRVTDDGAGIAPHELALAFARHATSKLRDVEDLWAIQTLGFRGEALPSIASVARVALISRHTAEALGRRLEVVGGALSPSVECGAPVGTTVEVHDLFFNTPARRKFLKSASAETAHVAALISALAAIRPEVSFTLTCDGRQVLTTAGDGEMRETLGALLGRGAERQLLAVEGEGAGVKVRGFIGEPALSRANRSWELFAVNGRLVEARLLQVAVEKAYGGLLPLRRYPVALLGLEVDPAEVDVNVHPAKREVRFRREADLFPVVHQAVRTALDRQTLYRPVEVPPPAADPRPLRPALPLARVSPSTPSFAPGLALAFARGTPVEAPGTAVVAATPPPAVSAPGQVREGNAGGPPEVAAAEEPVELSYLGQYAQTYLIAEVPGALVLVDQHAAHERVIFDALVAGFRSGSALPVQTLLWPENVELTPAESAVLEEALPALQRLGFEVEPFGGRAVLVRALPVLLSRAGFREVLAEVAGESPATAAAGAGRRPVPYSLERLFQTFACRGAIKAGQRLAPAEAVALLEEWRASDHPWTCPHGRPVALRWSQGDVETAFLRK